MTSEHHERGVADKVLDLLVYAPVGAIDMVLRDAPRLVAEGRQRLEQRVRTARWIGEMAVTVGRQKVTQRWASLVASPPEPQRTATATSPADTAASAASRHVDEGTIDTPTEPFHGYDALPASELVQLLFRLTTAELELVRSYESVTRARRTVLAKVDQLLGAV